MVKIIKYYRKNEYGNEREYIHPHFPQAAIAIRNLTNQKTINVRIREEITNLSDGFIKWEEVIAP